MPSLFDPAGRYQPGSSLFGPGLSGFGSQQQLGSWGYPPLAQGGGPGVTPNMDQSPLGGPQVAPGQAGESGFTGADPFSMGGFAPGFGSGPSGVAAGGQWGRSSDDLLSRSVYGDSAYNTGLDRALDTLGLGLLTAGLPMWAGQGVDAIQRRESGMGWTQALLGAAAGGLLPGGTTATDRLWDRYVGGGDQGAPAGGAAEPAPSPVANPWDHTGHWAPIRGADQLNFYGSAASMDPTAGDVLFMTGLADFYGPRR